MTSTQTTAPFTTRYRYPLLLGAGLVMMACLFIVSQVSPYHPGLSGAPGYEVRNATQPKGLAAGYIKEVHSFLEITPCEYEILGWGQDNVLYYRAVCGGRTQIWRADPVDLARAGPVAAAPGGLVNDTLAKAVVIDRVRALGVRPVSAEPVTRPIYVHSQPYPSPDGHWLAFVSKRNYGTQDVLLLTEAR